METEKSYILVSEYITSSPLVQMYETLERVDHAWQNLMNMSYCGTRITIYEIESDALGYRVTTEIRSKQFEQLSGRPL